MMWENGRTVIGVGYCVEWGVEVFFWNNEGWCVKGGGVVCGKGRGSVGKCEG
jgi:hypothetical protein